MLSPNRLLIPIAAMVILLCQWVFLIPEGGGSSDVVVINGDGRGYYDYLTSIFIDSDLSDQPINGRFIMDVDGRGVNKYFSGTAILMLPFFLLGWVWAALIGSPLDGFSPPFQWAMVFAALSYALLGAYFLKKLLSSYGFGDFIVQWCIIVVLFGTNMLYYSSVDATASHVYSFFTIAAFAWHARAFFLKGRPRSFLLTCLALGLTILVRPVNGVVLLILPYLAGTSTLFKGQVRYLLARTSLWIRGVAIVVGIGAIQLFFYRIQSGHWLVWSYSHEGFYFTDPALWSFLFSFERGWFVYSPFFILLIPAMILLWFQDRWKAFWLTSFFLLVVYLLSSWWSWHYGGSYGSRPMIDFYPLIAVPIAWAVSRLEFRYRNGALALVGFACIILTMMQVHQMNAGILSPWHMNASKYFWSVGKLDPETYADRLGGRVDTPPYHRDRSTIYEGDADISDGHWRIQHQGTSGQAVFNENIEYNLGFNHTFQKAPDGSVLLRFEIDRVSSSHNAGSNAFLVIEVKSENDTTRLYDAFRLDDHPDMALDEVEHFEYQYALRTDIQEEDQLKVYVWNKGLGTFDILSASASIEALHL